jgi:HD superfamily phosphohydrolase YqeK
VNLLDIRDYQYMKIPCFTGVLLDDIRNLLVINSKQNTFKHASIVAQTNVKLAEYFQLDQNICMISGLLHDISAIMKPNDMLAYVQNNNLYLDEAEKRYPFLLHQRISRLMAESLFSITDRNILSSIECHSTLKANPTAYDMSLFIADKLSWDQEGIPPYYKAVVDSLDKSIESASLAYMQYIVENKLILYPHLWFLQGMKYLESLTTE